MLLTRHSCLTAHTTARSQRSSHRVLIGKPSAINRPAYGGCGEAAIWATARRRPNGGRDPRCSCLSTISATEDDVVRYASVGDVVSIHFVMRDEDGQVLQSSEKDLGEPLSFEVGAGDMMGNRLFQGFDEAVRGMAVGQRTILEASGGGWKRELLFAVPRNHPEVQRLEGRYKNQGGLAPGLVVELANGAMAVILEVGDADVKLDANNMLAGKTFTIELELLSIDTPVSSDGP
ncbi:hypothetical protein VaNZ11_012741 [Volvox africanus]|uniref:peptidylprolyl isomerase n=1 Tax=Volvox africanus TaxID=51714 RepID=A0ABQ5SEY5_9CHLO|nr:hypothetical protein VaNZ11_012741 [Volvox africanus]